MEDVEENELFAGFAQGRFDAIICRELPSAFPQAAWAEIAGDELLKFMRRKEE